MTEEIFRTDAYAQNCDAIVSSINAAGGIVLDRTVFYPIGGGQPGDQGALETSDGQVIPIGDTVYDEARNIVHVPATPGSAEGRLAVGDKLRAVLDWDIRYPRMRMHSCMHLLSVVLPYPVTGGQLTQSAGRLDFDISEAGLDKQRITDELNALIETNMDVSIKWITEAELDAKPELVKTMAVKPPRGHGKIRLIRIGTADLQPCGGTHVANTGEIGAVMVRKIENKGAQNRRVRVVFA